MERIFLNILIGAAYFLFGVLLLLYPLWGIILLSASLGLFLILIGTMKIFFGVGIRRLAVWWIPVGNGIVAIVLGIALLILTRFFPVTIIGVFAGIDFLIMGAWLLAFSYIFDEHILAYPG